MSTVSLKKIIILCIFAASITAFFIFDLDWYFSLSFIKESKEKILMYYSSNRIITLAVYMIIYIMITALSLPGATVMTLAGGAFFGFTVALAVVSFASTIGATIACSVSRYILRDWLEKKFGDMLNIINRGIEKDGVFYLFMIRLVPLFPFFLVNIVMGLTRIRLITFYWISQAGMLAGTAVYVYAGSELGRIESLSGILSPGLIISFVILGVFPLAVKRILNLYIMKFRKS